MMNRLDEYIRAGYTEPNKLAVALRMIPRHMSLVPVNSYQLATIPDVSISTTGYHFVVDADQWRCLENGEFVDVTSDGDIWNADRTYTLPLYGHSQHDD